MVPQRFYPAPAIEVRCDAADAPTGFLWRRRWSMVAHTEALWQQTNGWWQADVEHRAYFRVVARDGLRCVIYRDLQTGTWHMHMVMD